MKKEIIISEANDLAVVFEDGRAAEFFLRSGDQLVGDIIWGQVEAVVPGIEAAFVNIGQDRNGFIHVADLPSAQAPRKQAAPKRPSIRVRERILVQIAKAPTGSKGARLTGRLTIPGRFLVLVPDDNRVSISRRITDTHERDRLRRLTLKLKDPGHGLIVRTEAIIQSMTPAERANPKLLNGSRRLRIAKGSGMTVTDINQLVTRFEQAAKMMKTVARGGVPNVPGMGPMAGGGFAGRKPQKKKGKSSRSGNPAKRAAENAALASGAKPGGSAGGSGFGLGAGQEAAQQAPTGEELAAVQKLFGRG